MAGTLVGTKGMRMLRNQDTGFVCPNSHDYYGRSVYVMGGSVVSFFLSAVFLIIALINYAL